MGFHSLSQAQTGVKKVGWTSDKVTETLLKGYKMGGGERDNKEVKTPILISWCGEREVTP